MAVDPSDPYAREARTARRERRLPAVLAGALALALLAPPAARASEAVVAKRVGHAPDLVWATLNDVEAWRRFFPSGAELAVERIDESRHRVRATTSMAGLRVRYSLIATTAQAQCQVRFALDPAEPSDLRQLESTWTIERVDEGESRIVLRVVSDSGLPVPGFVERRFTAASTQETVDAFLEELAARAVQASATAPF